MVEELDQPPLKDVYRKLVTDTETNPVFKKYSYNAFRDRMLNNPEASGEVADFLIDRGVIKDREDWKKNWLEPSVPPAPKPVAAPQRPVQVPTLLQPAQQGPSLSAVTGQQAVTPMQNAPEPQFQPFQFQSQKEIDQAAKSPVFLANPMAVEAQKGNIIMPTKEAEADFQSMTPEQQQAVIQGSSGGRLSREADEKKKTLRQKLADSFNSVKSYGADLVKSAKRGWEQGNAIQTAKLTDLATGNAEGIDFDAMAKANKVVRDMGATDTELDFAQSDGIWDDISDWMKMVLPVAIESTATLASSGLEEIATGAATGAAIGSVVPGAGTMAGAATGAMGGVSTAGYNMELYASILDGLDEKGVDVTNPAALKKAFSDKELIGPILKRANTRAAIIGVVDLVGGEMIGHTGRMLKNAEKAGKMSKGMGRLIRGVERTRGLDEAVTGSAGELAAQVGSGQEVNWQDVGLEGAGGAPMVALQGALSKGGQPAQTPPKPPTQLGGINTIPAPEGAPEFDIESNLKQVQADLAEIAKMDPTTVSPQAYNTLKAKEAALLSLQQDEFEANGQQHTNNSETPEPSSPEIPNNSTETEFVTVTDDELNAFRNGTLNDEARMNAVVGDAMAIEQGAQTLDDLPDDPNYREMVSLTLQSNEPTQQPSAAPVGQTQQSAGGVGEGVSAVVQQETPVAEEVGPVEEGGLTKESVTKKLGINHPFYQKVSDALAKLGLIQKYNPETQTGDVLGGYVQKIVGGGFSSGKFIFNKNGDITYFDNGVEVRFDQDGNVISENIAEAKQKAANDEIEGRKSAIENLKKIRDSEDFKYKTVTRTDDITGEKKTSKRLKTAEELKESTDKINAAISKAETELAALQANETPTNPVPVAADETGGAVVQSGPEPVAAQSGGPAVEVPNVSQQEVAAAAAEEVDIAKQIAREFLNIDRLVAKGFVEYVDSKTGKPCAKYGMRDNAFSRGGKWEIIKDLKGYATHEKGGVDLTIDNKGVRIGGPDSKLYAADGLLMPNNGEPIPPQKKQQLAEEERVKFLKYMDDPTYKKRLGAELFGDKFNNLPEQNKLVESEYAKRRTDIEKIPISEGNIGNDYGLYTDPYSAGKKKNPQGTIQITSAVASHEDHPSQNEGTYKQVVAHELGHASHRGDVAGDYERDSKFEQLVEQYHNPDLEKLADLFHPGLGWASKKERQDIIDAASKQIGAEQVQKILKKKDELELEVEQKQQQYGKNYDPNIHGPFYPKEFLEIMDVPRYNHLKQNPTEIATRMIGIRRLAADKFGYDFNTPFDISKYKEPIRKYLKENNMIDEMSDLDTILKLSDEQINEMMKYIAKNKDNKNGEVHG